MTDEAPTIVPASTTTTKTETVKTTVGSETNGSAPSVIVVTQSKIALLNQLALSILAGIFALGLVIAFVTPLFITATPILTAGEFIGGIAAAAGVITGSAYVNRNAPARATDIPRPTVTTTP